MTRTPRAVLLAIDPGLDRAAAALFDLTDWRGPVTGAVDVARGAERLRYLRQAETNPKDNMPVRLAQLTEWAWHLSGEVRALLDWPHHTALTCANVRVVVEWPAFAGLYAGRTEGRSRRVLPNAGAMAGLYAATGAIVAGVTRWCNPTRVAFEPAARVPRDLKQQVAKRAIELSPLASLNGHVPKNDDTRSAVFIGLSADWHLP